jgi:hypothetical protein
MNKNLNEFEFFSTALDVNELSELVILYRFHKFMQVLHHP